MTKRDRRTSTTIAFPTELARPPAPAAGLFGTEPQFPDAELWWDFCDDRMVSGLRAQGASEEAIGDALERSRRNRPVPAPADAEPVTSAGDPGDDLMRNLHREMLEGALTQWGASEGTMERALKRLDEGQSQNIAEMDLFRQRPETEGE